MTLEELYQRLELTGKGGFVSLSSSNWVQQSGLPERILRTLKSFLIFEGVDLISNYFHIIDNGERTDFL